MAENVSVSALQGWVIILLLTAVLFGLVLLAVFLILWEKKNNYHDLRLELSKDNADMQNTMASMMRGAVADIRDETENQFHSMETHLEQTLNVRMNAESVRSQQSDQLQHDLLRDMERSMLTQNHEAQEKILHELVDSVQTMMHVNGDKLSQIQQEISDKLDRSLNERLDESFDKIGIQLGNLYRTVGELQSLSTGVDSLNRTLSNVKKRGTWGEMQLEQILADLFPADLYVKNAQTRENTRERVEFALKIPDKSGGKQFILLPIDSKFPLDIYNKIQEASVSANVQAMESALKEMDSRIRSEAREIGKYLNPPQTTDFAIMFLPSEGIYSEVLRIPGLSEYCQKNCHVILSGPTTIAALLNSLAVGFRYLTISRRSSEVLKLLQNLKGQYEQFGDLIEKTQSSLDGAVRSTEAMRHRSQLIQRRLEQVETWEPAEEIMEKENPNE